VTSTTVFGPGSFEAVAAASGQAIAAVDHAWRGDTRLAYALVRPPGHHAQPAMADGYCFVNNIAVAIEAARARGLRRAAVIDWDVHHGNGTQAGYYRDPDVLTISLHMNHGAWGPSHLQTGAPEEAGEGAGLGSNLNVALPFGSGDECYRSAFDRLVAPRVEEFAPELIVVACGQDANQFDPNGRNCVTMQGFHDLGRRARQLADRCSNGRLALVQEGGYALSYAALCLHATLAGVLLEEQSIRDPIAFLPEAHEGISAQIDEIGRRWRHAVAR
jgi:acetoin utilization deacetylase AcuC-like enzyme